MATPTWQRSSYCAQGEACIYVTTDHGAVHLTETGDPTGAILRATPSAWAALIRTVKEAPARD